MTEVEKKIVDLQRAVQQQHQSLKNLQNQSLFIGFTVEFLSQALETANISVDWNKFDEFANMRLTQIQAEATAMREAATKAQPGLPGLKLDE